MQRLVDLISESAVSFKFEEASGEVDGQHIIGKISGPFFVPDGVSRNNRKYPRELWEKVCNSPNVRSRLEDRRMFGTIGHKQKLDDEALLEGKMALVTTNLQVQNGRGMGEAYIIGTPAGKILNTVLRAGCKLFVSSRADGSFKGEDKGIPIVDPDTYQLEGFDVVLDPGFLQANPKLVEKFDQILAEVSATENHNHEGDYQMDTKLIESIAKENASLKAELERATTEIESFKSSKTSLMSENSHLRSKLDKQRKAEGLMKKYEVLGSPEEIEKAMDLTEKKLSKWNELGSLAQVSKALTEADRLLKQYKAIGTVQEINKALDASLKVVGDYKSIGTPAEINRSYDVMETEMKKVRESKSKTRIAELAKELKVSEEKIKTVYGKISETEIKKLFANTKEGVSSNNNTASKFVKRSFGSSVTETAPSERKSFSSKKLGARLMESLGGTEIK